MKLEKPHPELAARLWRAQAMRIVDAGKSRVLRSRRREPGTRPQMLLRAGLVAEWEDAVRQIRADHFRKSAFMAAFESVAAGAGHKPPPSFLERAKTVGVSGERELANEKCQSEQGNGRTDRGDHHGGEPGGRADAVTWIIADLSRRPGVLAVTVTGLSRESSGFVATLAPESGAPPFTHS